MSRKRDNPYAKPDARTRAAKQSGYAARSVFKLQEIDKRYHVFKQGQRILDLGAAPGSWTQFASQKIGGAGRVLAIDLTLVEDSLGKNVEFAQADALDLDSELAARHAPYDVVMSDMAPNTTGLKITDQARSYELFMAALQVAITHLKPGGTFIGKIFMSEDFPQAKSAVVAAFDTTKTIRPKSTRQKSSELFLLGQDRKPPAP